MRADYDRFPRFLRAAIFRDRVIDFHRILTERIAEGHLHFYRAFLRQSPNQEQFLCLSIAVGDRRT